MCVNNAWIIFKENTKSKIGLRDFILNVSDSLIHSNKAASIPVVKSKQYNFQKQKDKSAELHSLPLVMPSVKSATVNLDIRYDDRGHLPMYNETRKRCVYCAERKEENASYVSCVKCKISLCFVKGRRNCFLEYHKQV